MTKHFITTAIDYVNASPHAGHALEKIQADVLSRYYRSLGDEVFFLTGTDENSLKNVQSAEKEGLPIKEFVERNAKQFMRLAQELNLSNDDFIRTTETRHTLGVQKLWQACLKDIYKKTYQGLYCVGCEEFYKEDELVDGFCPEHKVKPELVSEEDYFFRLSKYQETLSDLISSNQLEIIPESKKNEVLSFINSGLEDICISRSAQRAHHWGIDVPNDSNQKIWVWFDALSNYLTALGYATESEQFKKWWLEGEDILHCIGKGISRFHAVYWPAILLSAGLPLPKRIFVHGYLTVKGEKMAKSLGNIIDPFELLNQYGSEVVRYFFLREFSATEDGDFSEERIKIRYESDLAQGLGNLVSRILALGENYGKPITLKENELREVVEKDTLAYHQKMRDFKFNEALNCAWEIINILNKYLTTEKPWEQLTRQSDQFLKEISSLILSLGRVALLIKPVMPQTSEKILTSLGLVQVPEKDWLQVQVTLKRQLPLFPKF